MLQRIFWFCMLFLFALPGFSLLVRTGDTVMISEGEHIDDDLVLSGGTVQFAGQANNDLVVAAGTANIQGRVGGDLILAGGNVTVRGPVAGTIYLAGGTPLTPRLGAT